ncbi:MAG: hypothetical protein ACPGU7_10860, partial [Gammaproteobacteria bacterium]
MAEPDSNPTADAAPLPSADPQGSVVGSADIPPPPESVTASLLGSLAQGAGVPETVARLQSLVRRHVLESGGGEEEAGRAADAYTQTLLESVSVGREFADALDSAVDAYIEALGGRGAFEPVERSPAEQLVATLAEGEGVGEAVTDLIESIRDSRDIPEGEDGLEYAQGLFLEEFQAALNEGLSAEGAMERAINVFDLTRQDVQAQSVPLSAADAIVAALSGGEAGADALETLAAEAGFDPDQMDRFLDSVQDVLASGGDMDAAIEAGRDSVAAQQLAAEAQAVPLSAADRLAAALAAGGDGDAIPDGPGGEAFIAALEAGLADGGVPSDVLADANAASDAATRQEAVQDVPLSPAQALAAALSAGGDAGEALAAAGLAGGDGLAGEGVAAALADALAFGQTPGEALSGAQETAASLAEQEQAQEVPLSPADQMIAALAGAAGDPGAALPSAGETGAEVGEDFAQQLVAALADGTPPGAAVEEAASASSARQQTEQQQSVPVQDPVVAAMSGGDEDNLPASEAALADAAGDPGAPASGTGGDSGESTPAASVADGSSAGGATGNDSSGNDIGGDAVASVDGGDGGDGGTQTAEAPVADTSGAAGGGGTADTSNDAGDDIVAGVAGASTLSGSDASGPEAAGPGVSQAGGGDPAPTDSDTGDELLADAGASPSPAGVDVGATPPASGNGPDAGDSPVAQDGAGTQDGPGTQDAGDVENPGGPVAQQPAPTGGDPTAPPVEPSASAGLSASSGGTSSDPGAGGSSSPDADLALDVGSGAATGGTDGGGSGGGTAPVTYASAVNSTSLGGSFGTQSGGFSGALSGATGSASSPTGGSTTGSTGGTGGTSPSGTSAVTSGPTANTGGVGAAADDDPEPDDPQPANLGPTISAGSDRSYTEDASAVILSQELTVEDSDSGLIEGATVRFTAGFVAGEDRLVVDTAGTPISASFDADSGLLTLSGRAASGDYQAVLRGLGFINDSDDPTSGVRSIEVTVDDGALTATSTWRVGVEAVNDAPVLTAFGAVVESVNEDTRVEISFADLLAQGDETDVDGSVQAFVVQAVNSGTLLIGDSPATATAFAVGSNDTVSSGAKAYWTPDANANGTLNAFTVRARDDGGAVSATPVQARVSVNDVNDAPTLTAFASVAETVNEDTQVEITFAELAAQGDEADVDGTVQAFVVQAVSSGTLLIGTSSATATAFAAGTNDVIDATHHAYWTGAADANGTLNAFTLKAKDDDGALSATAIQARVSVNDVNDAPTLSTFASTVDTVDEDTQVEITFAELAAQGDE